MEVSTVLQAELMKNLPWIIGGIVLFLVLSLIVFIQLNIKMGRLNKKYEQMMTGVEKGNLEAVLLKYLDDVRQAKSDIDQLEARCDGLDKQLLTCIQQVGVVRFNAFEDTGSDLSYAIALLDDKCNGVVLSSIFGRTEACCYAKPIIDGQSTYFLTDEEKQAMAKALEKNRN